jgi:N-acetylmuramoyl-L-alanine amidase
LHCSASDNSKHDNLKTITEWHLERGFSDVGYHYVITQDGFIHRGRNLEKIPAAQKGFNTGTIAICLTGLNNFTDIQFKSLQRLCNDINTSYKGNISYHGHCEVSNKSCPVFNYKKVLQLSPSGKMPKN